MFKAKFIVLNLLLAGLAACSTGKKDQPQTQPRQPAAQQPAPVPAQPAESAPPPSAPAPPPVATAPAPPKVGPPASGKGKAGATRSATREREPASPRGSVPPQSEATQPEPRANATPRVESPPVVPAEPPRPKFALIPSGTRMAVRLSAPINSGVDRTGDTFGSTLGEDLTVNGKIVVPKGSLVAGKLVRVEGSGRVEGRAEISLTLTELRVAQEPYPIRTNTLDFVGESSRKGDVAKIGGGAGIGAVIGAIAGGKKGAAIGAAVGGGAGAATVLATKGKELKFDVEHEFKFTLRQDLQVPLR